MRGEDLRMDDATLSKSGSPPHARGRLVCAGDSGIASSDHPRMRGENYEAHKIGLDANGSPPHARGKPDRQSDAAPRRWITPACAGKTAFYD